MGWGIGTVRRPARRLSRARYTHHDGGTGGRMESERQQSWSALKRRHAAFAAPFLKCYFIWTVTAASSDGRRNTLQAIDWTMLPAGEPLCRVCIH
jgi:hypothetical protein